MRLDELAPGDRTYRWWNSGALGSNMQPLTVVRVNQKTVTVRTDQRNEFRIDPAQLEGFLLAEYEDVYVREDVDEIYNKVEDAASRGAWGEGGFAYTEIEDLVRGLAKRIAVRELNFLRNPKAWSPQEWQRGAAYRIEARLEHL